MSKQSHKPVEDPQGFLAQLLSGGQTLFGKANSLALSEQAQDLGQRGEDFLIDKLGLEDDEASREQIRQQAKYAGVAGAIALILSSRSARKLATLGSLAAIGTIAYKGHKRGTMPKDFSDAIGLLTGQDAETRSDKLLRAMIAAAQADGVISTEETALIKAYPKADLDRVSEILSTPADPNEIASMASSDQFAYEIYAVSCRVADGVNPKERDYLDRLAMALRLDPESAALIETEVRTG